jgi:NTE family protein
MIKGKKIGLALSGGGFRAAAFHLGTLKKLHELGILPSTDVISTISGGSIIGAYYALNKDKFSSFDQFVSEFQDVLQKNLILRACFTFRFLSGVLLILISIVIVAWLSSSWSITIIYILLLAVFIGAFFYKIFPTTRLIKRLYDKLIFDYRLLKELPESPMLVINATNLDTGTLFSYTRNKSFDGSYFYLYNKNILFDTGNFSVAKAVACSTAVPYAFSPTMLKFEIDGNKITPKLVDGGIYDNQGIYRVITGRTEYRSDVVIVSDASAPFKKNFLGINPLPVLGRIMNVMMKRIKSVQFLESIYEDDEEELYEIGYYSLDWEYENCLDSFYNATKKNKIRPHLLSSHNITDEMKKDLDKLKQHLKTEIGYDKIVSKGLVPDEIKFVKNIKTSLKSLSLEEIDLLIRHAEALTEIQIKLYCPVLI